MVRIDMEYCRSMGLVNDFNFIQHLDIDVPPSNVDISFSPDDNGTTYFCSFVNGLSSVHDLTIKLFHFCQDRSAPKEYLRLLDIQSNILIYQDTLEEGQINPFKMEIFRTIPQFIFKGYIHGFCTYGYGSLTLGPGWNSFRKIQDKLINKEESDKFYNLSLSTKRAMALELITGLSYLNECELAFINLQDQNLIINNTSGKITIIDYEKIWVINSEASLSDLVSGGWFPPEVNSKLDLAESYIHPTREMGYYTIAVALFNLFSNSPAYIGTRIRLDTINKLIDIPEVWRNAFKRSFLSEFDTLNKRMNYNDWAKILIGINNSSNPISNHIKDINELNEQTVIDLSVDKEVIIEGMSVTLKWSISGQHEQVFLNNGIGNVTGINKLELHPHQDTTYEITVKNAIGETKQTITVLVYPKPSIPDLKFPEMNLDSNTFFKIEEKIIPEFCFQVDPVNINLPAIDLKSHVELNMPTLAIIMPDYNFEFPPVNPKELEIDFPDKSLIESLIPIQDEIDKYHFKNLYKQVKNKIRRWRWKKS